MLFEFAKNWNHNANIRINTNDTNEIIGIIGIHSYISILVFVTCNLELGTYSLQTHVR
jgi:hypothetical protein